MLGAWIGRSRMKIIIEIKEKEGGNENCRVKFSYAEQDQATIGELKTANFIKGSLMTAVNFLDPNAKPFSEE